MYDIQFVLSQSLPDALSSKIIKSRFSLTGIWPFDKGWGFLAFCVTDCPREDNKQKSTVFVVSTSNSGVSSHSSTSGLHAGPSASEGNERHLGPDNIRRSPKAGVRKESRKRKKLILQ